MTTSKPTKQRQQGAALLLMLLAVILAVSGVLVANLDGSELRARQQLDTGMTLALARTALLDYAVVNPDLSAGNSFTLPCPDVDDSGGFESGEAHTTACGAEGETVIGRLPWRTLGIAALQDSSSACLWYVVSGSYKEAGSETVAMVNTDSNGQLQLFSTTSGTILEGLLPEERPVAMVIATLRPLTGQTRAGQTPPDPCASGANPADYLESDPGSGISNALLNGVPDSIDAFAVAPGITTTHNDRVVTISRAQIAERVSGRLDFETRMRQLGLAAASCVANYAATNPGGANDKRLPWPAGVAMSDYRSDAAYDDVDNGFLSGRLADLVADSNAITGNTIARVLGDCDTTAVPEWTPTMRSTWQHWKDHFFYAVAAPFAPTAAVPSNCGTCITVNGSGQYAGLLLFSNTRLNDLGQVRNAPPLDTDTKDDTSNYLENANAGNIPTSVTASDYVSAPSSTVFNDLLFCIDDQLVVAEC